MMMKMVPAAALSHCWKCSNPLLIFSAPLIAFFMSHAMIMTGRLAEMAKTRGMSAPMWLVTLSGIIMPK